MSRISNLRLQIAAKCVVWAAGGLLALCFVPTAARADYQFMTLDTPRGYPDTQIYGINNNRLVSGLDVDPNGDSVGLLFTNGMGTTHNVPAAIDTEFYQVNNAGQVGVSYYSFDDVYHAAVYNNGTWSFLPDVPGTAENLAGGINNHGLVLGGTFSDSNFNGGVGWTWNGSQYSFFTAPGSNAAQGGTGTYSLNDNAQIVGYFFDSAGVEHGYLKTGSSYQVLDAPLATSTIAYGINNNGVVVGSYDIGPIEHGFIWQNGTFTTFDFPNAVDTTVTAINDLGDLGGFYTDANGDRHGFVALVPEPGAAALLLGPAVMLLARRRCVRYSA